MNFAVVIDHSKYLTRIGEPDVTQRLITVQPGAINEQVNIVAGKHNLVFGPDPSTHAYCTIGGNVGNNSCGVHSVQSQIYGPGPRTSDNVHSMDIALYGGERMRVGVNEEAQLEEIIRAGGRKGEIYRQLRDLRDRYADAIRKGFKPVTGCRAASPATTWMNSCRNADSTSRAPWWERKAPVSPLSK